MGFLSELAGRPGSKAAPRLSSRAAWDRAFRITSKDERLREEPARATRGRSIAGADSAIARLITALRSQAPGGWTDDRFEQSRHYVGIQYVAIHRCGEQLQQAEFQVFRKDPESPEGRVPVRPEDRPEGDRLVRPYDLVQLLERPNNEDYFGDLCYDWNMQMDLTGTALTWMAPSAAGAPMELYPIATAVAVPQAVLNEQYPDGYYRVQPLYPYGPFSSMPSAYSSVGAAIDARWVMRMKYRHPYLRYEGYAPLTALRQHIDEVEMMDRSRTASMRGSMRPSAVLNFPGLEQAAAIPPEEIERIRADFAGQLAGPENHGALYVASPGGKLDPWGTSPVDMDYQGGWEQLVSFVLGGLGITKPAAGMIEDSSYSTLFATMKQLYWQTLDPKCTRFGRVLTRHLAPFFGDGLIVEVRCKPIDDHEVKERKLTLLFNAKAITKGELRTELEMPVGQHDWEKDIAGDPSPGEKEQQQQQGGQPGAPGGAPPATGQAEKPASTIGEPAPEADREPAKAEPANAGTKPADDRMRLADGTKPPQDQEQRRIERSRPRPGRLGTGALGPRMKALPRRKSMYDRVREALANGHR